MSDANPPVALVATDRLSESIDLDGGDVALLHQDLPWNPARLTQRWGRIVRRSSDFRKPEAHACLVMPLDFDRRIAEVVLRRRDQVDLMLPAGHQQGEESEGEDLPWARLTAASRRRGADAQHPLR